MGIILGILFSMIGLVAVRFASVLKNIRYGVLGLALMIYPYFIYDTWPCFIVGSVLTFFLFWPTNKSNPLGL